MQFERKHYIYILVALILSLTALAEEQTISSELANYTEINTSRIFKEWDTSTSEILLYEDGLYLNHVNGGVNEVKITSTDTQFMHDIDMAGNNINNCGNCGGSDNLSWQNSKVNKSGNETITGDITIKDAYFNLTTNKTFYLDFNTLPNIMRNSTAGTYRTSPLATINLMLKVAGGIGNGGGPALIFWNKGNETENNVESNLGRVALVWSNKTGNESRMDTYLKHGDEDVNGLSPAYSVYVSPKTLVNTSSTQNYTLETGNLKLTNKTGTGYEFACFDSDGNLIRSLVSCDLI